MLHDPLLLFTDLPDRAVGIQAQHGVPIPRDRALRRPPEARDHVGVGGKIRSTSGRIVEKPWSTGHRLLGKEVSGTSLATTAIAMLVSRRDGHYCVFLLPGDTLGVSCRGSVCKLATL